MTGSRGVSGHGGGEGCCGARSAKHVCGNAPDPPYLLNLGAHTTRTLEMESTLLVRSEEVKYSTRRGKEDWLGTKSAEDRPSILLERRI